MDAKNAEEKSTAAALPSVPTVSPAVPAAQSAQEDETADLDMALAEL